MEHTGSQWTLPDCAGKRSIQTWEYPTSTLGSFQTFRDAGVRKGTAAMDIVKVDAKGRVVLPASIRGRAGVEPGDVYFVAIENSVIRLAKAINPFDALAEEAIAEYEAGNTTSLRDFAEEEGIDLDAGETL